MGVAQFIMNIFSPVQKVEKNWGPFTSGIPSRIEPCRVLCAVLAGGDNFKGVMHIFGLGRFATAGGFQHGRTGRPSPMTTPETGAPSKMTSDPIGNTPQRSQRTGNG